MQIKREKISFQCLIVSRCVSRRIGCGKAPPYHARYGAQHIFATEVPQALRLAESLKILYNPHYK